MRTHAVIMATIVGGVVVVGKSLPGRDDPNCACVHLLRNALVVCYL
jgi:hypothetical protein